MNTPKAGGAASSRPLAERVLAGEQRAVARLISGLEDGDPAAVGEMRSLRGRSGRAHLIGITGPPGSGKSTLTDKLIGVLRARGARVGVLAVDPSSPFTGGAILGDRLRMQGHATDPGVFIRSLASRGRLGGLSRATQAAARVLDAAGYDYVVIETVGVGQSEVDIVKIADTVVLVSVPGLGDDIQVIKAGIMEIGDVFVVNKSDREGSDRVVREIRGMLETAAALKRAALPEPVDTLSGRGAAGLGAAGLGAATGPGLPGAGQGRQAPAPLSGEALSHHLTESANSVKLADDSGLPPVLKTVAETGEGVEELVDAILAHRAGLAASGALEARRLEGIRAEMRALIAFRLLDALEGGAGRAREDALSRAVLGGDADVYGASEELFSSIAKGEAK